MPRLCLLGLAVMTFAQGLGRAVINGYVDRQIRFWDIRTPTYNELAIEEIVASLDHFPGNKRFALITLDILILESKTTLIKTSFERSQQNSSVVCQRHMRNKWGQ